MAQKTSSRILARLGLNIGLDGLLAAAGVVLAYWLENPGSLWPRPVAMPLAGAAAIGLIGVSFGLSRQHWRFTSLEDIFRIAAAAGLTALMLTLLMAGAGLPLPSLGFPIVLAMSLGMMLTLPRLLYRLARQPSRKPDAGAAQTAILIGSGETAELFLAAMARFPAVSYRITGLIGMTARDTGRQVQGFDILGGLDAVDAVLARLAAAGKAPDVLIITSPEIGGENLKILLAAAEKAAIRVMRAPSLTALAPALPGEGEDIRLQPIAIEDLLNRRQIALDRAGLAGLISARRVLVTGAGGSIGAELARQVAALAPAEILLLDNGEYALWQIDLELAETQTGITRQAVIADVRDAARMRQICRDFRPDLVFHAAALKHVPIVEANPLEGLLTNVAGTRHVADAAQAAGAALMVLISTDKAVNPSSVMGASKRLAEMYAQGLDVTARKSASAMRCVTVRFGNVLGSTGSVVPLFRRQLSQGGPLTVTHPDMQRYFMTVREAVGLVLQASAIGSGAAAIPDGGIFVLDMGEPVKIADLARQMIRLAGLRPEIDIKINFTGLRPGEKLFEELFHGSEQPEPTGFPGLLMATPRSADARLVAAAITEIESSAARGDAGHALAVLSRVVPEFAHNADGGDEAVAVSAASG